MRWRHVKQFIIRYKVASNASVTESRETSIVSDGQEDGDATEDATERMLQRGCDRGCHREDATATVAAASGLACKLVAHLMTVRC